MAVMQRPTTYLNWTEGLGPNNVKPPPELAATGWQAGMPVPAPFQNYITWLMDQWIQYLSEGINSTVLATSLDHSMRLIGGGTFSYNAGTTTLSWAAPLYIAIPSIPDADNMIPAGSVSVPAGSVAYATVNLPFTTSGDLTSGSKTVKNIAFDGSIAVGQTVSGPGIPANTTVTALSKTSLTLSQAATAAGTQVALTFANTGALTVSVAPSSSLVPNPQTTVIARSLGAAISVGVGSTELWLRDGEQRTLVTAGYVTTVQAPAGVAISALQPVYLSQGTSDGRTQASVYPCDASAANGAQRGYCIGFAHTATSPPNVCHVVQGGFLSGFAGLVPGAVYYLDPSVVGGITATKPTTEGQYVAPIGVATSTTQLLIHINPNLPLTTVFSSITVTGTSTFKGAVTAQAGANVTGPLSVDGKITGTSSAINGATVLSGPTTLSGATTANGDFTVTGNIGLNGTTNIGGGLITLNSGVRFGSTNYGFGAAGTASFLNVQAALGIKAVVWMGNFWGKSDNQNYQGLYESIVNQAVSGFAPGVMPRKWAASHAGFIRGLSPMFYSASSGNWTIRVIKNGAIFFTAQTATLAANTYVTTTYSYSNQYAFAVGDVLEIQQFHSVNQVNTQVKVDMTVGFTDT